MRWLTKLVDEIVTKQPEGEVLIESGASPSGRNDGLLRECMTSPLFCSLSTVVEAGVNIKRNKCNSATAQQTLYKAQRLLCAI